MILHEVGHSFGLTDEDGAERAWQSMMGTENKPDYSKSEEEKYCTHYQGCGLMSYDFYYRGRTANDVMGLITILDRFTQTYRIIYPLLSDYNRPPVGAIVAGKYVYPPMKKGKFARELYNIYFSHPWLKWNDLYNYGHEVFEQYFSLVPGYPAKYKFISRRQKEEQARIKAKIIKNLQEINK